MTDIIERLRDIEMSNGQQVTPFMMMTAGQAITEIVRLRAVVQAGVDMRDRQKTYFKTRNKGDLIASKQAEYTFDRAAKEGTV